MSTTTKQAIDLMEILPDYKSIVKPTGFTVIYDRNIPMKRTPLGMKSPAST